MSGNVICARWAAVSVHVALLVFSLAVSFDLLKSGFTSRPLLIETSPEFEHAMALSALLVIGNAAGIGLLSASIFKTHSGRCLIVLYEASIFFLSFCFLAPDLGVVVGVILAMTLYAAVAQKIADGREFSSTRR